MSNLFRIGFILLVIAFIAWFYEDEGHKLPLSDDLDFYIAIAGLISLAIFSFFYAFILFFSKTSKALRNKRCPRCGKRVKKGEMYCEFHQRELQAEYLSGLADEQSLRRRSPDEK